MQGMGEKKSIFHSTNNGFVWSLQGPLSPHRADVEDDLSHRLHLLDHLLEQVHFFTKVFRCWHPTVLTAEASNGLVQDDPEKKYVDESVNANFQQLPRWPHDNSVHLKFSNSIGKLKLNCLISFFLL